MKKMKTDAYIRRTILLVGYGFTHHSIMTESMKLQLLMRMKAMSQIMIRRS